jgi:hypothetical protein
MAGVDESDSSAAEEVAEWALVEPKQTLHKLAAVRRSLGLPETIIIGLFIACATVATGIPTPLLQSPSLPTGEVVFPKFVSDGHLRFDMPKGKGVVRIESAPEYGCIQIDAVDGKRVGPVCNRHMHCLEGSTVPPFRSSLSIYKMQRVGEYYVDTGSACYSFCCDLRGMTFSGEGRRLDDGPMQRILLRLGIFGIIPLVIGVVCAILRVRKTRSLAARLGVILGFAFPIFMLLWNR